MIRNSVAPMIFIFAMAMLDAAPASAAVFEVGEDGMLVQLDTPAPAAPRVARQVRGRIAQATTGATRALALRAVVEQAATRYEVSPALVDAIAYAESRYDQRALSRAGAQGIMQLMPGTARDLGVDSRDTAANIHGGTAYLRRLLNRFDGDVVCTIAAYNAGPGAVSKARCIPPYRETLAYVAVVLDRLSQSAH
jgi:soluble lytic murein transglycosylase-like protein